MDNVTILRALPSTSALECKLRAAGHAMQTNSEVVKLLDRYSKARAALARNVAAASAAAFGLAVAAAEDELPPHEAARVAREVAATLEALVS
jgi:hypothetical protein